MKKLLFLLLICAPAHAQGVRIGPNQVTQEATVATSTNVVTVPSNPIIAFCDAPANAVPCTNRATTYTDSTLVTPCATSTQIVLDGTSTCVANPDALSNWGVWVAPGQYAYTITTANGNFGPYFVTASTALPAVIASLDQAGVTTANSGTPQNVLASTPAAGHYRLSYYVPQSAGCATVGSGALTVLAGWTDATHARVSATDTLTPSTAATGTTSFVNRVVDLWSATASAITITATYAACMTGTWTYDLHATVERTE